MNIKKILTCALSALLLLSAGACSAGTGGEYPVRIAGYVISEKPASVVCLSDSVADILIACGYANAIAAKSDECTQAELSDVPSVGSKANPSVSKLMAFAPQIVFVDKTVSQDSLTDLGENVQVLNMITAQTGDELSILYSSIGAVMAGDKTGREKAEKLSKSLLMTLSDLQRLVPDKDVVPTACYLYDENGKAASSNSFCGRLFEYAKTINVCSSAMEAEATLENLRLNDPQYIFCDKGVKAKLANHKDLKKLNAVKSGRVYEIESTVFERQGDTMTEVLSFLIETIYPELKTSPKAVKEESSAPASVPEESSKPESSAPPEDAVKEDTSLTITDDMYVAYGAQGEEVEKIQNRLKDLGFGVFPDGTTDYFGDQSVEAYMAFESANGLEANGEATAEELRLLFSAEVKKAAPVESSEETEGSPAEEITEEPEEPAEPAEEEE